MKRAIALALLLVSSGCATVEETSNLHSCSAVGVELKITPRTVTCDYRNAHPFLAAQCEEDQLCAIQEIVETGNYK